MSKLIDHYKASANITLDLGWQRGSLLDRSGYGNHVVGITNPEAVFWTRNKLGHALRVTGLGRPYCADSASLKLVNTGCTFITLGSFESHRNGRLLSKRVSGVGGSAWDIYTRLATTDVAFYDGTNESLMVGSVTGSRMIAVTLAGAGQKPKLYVDGTYKSEGSLAITIPDAALNPVLYIGNFYNGSGPSGFAFSRSLVLKVALSAAEISKLYQELMSERYPLRAYSLGCRISVPKDPPGVAALLKTDFTTRLADGRLADLSGNGWHGTVKPGFVAGPGMCGNSLVANSATRSYVDFGDVTPLNGASKVTIIWAGNTGTRSPTEIVFDKGSGAGARFDFDAHATIPIWYIGGKYCTISDANVGTPQCFGLRYNGELDNANKALIFRDGVQVTTTPQADMPSALPNTAGTPFVMGRLSWANNNPPPAKTDFLAIYPAAMTQEQVQYVYRQIARRSTFALDMQRVPVSLANMVGPCEVPGTPFRVAGGTWKVSEDTTGKRWFETVATNNTSVYVPTSQAYGTFVFDVYHTASAEYADIMSNVTNRLNSTRTIYSVVLSSTTLSFSKYTPSSGLTVLMSSSASVALNTAYKIAVTRSSIGVFAVYIKGGVYADWTLVTASSGTNPVTDTTYTTNKYFMFSSSIAGNSKFSQPRFFAGALTLDQLKEACQ